MPSTPRILHLIDDSQHDVWPVTLACVQRLIYLMPDAQHEVQLIGNDRLRRWASDQDFSITSHLSAYAVSGLNVWKLKKELSFSPPFAQIHSWSLGALKIARHCFRHTPIFHHQLKPPTSQREWAILKACTSRLYALRLICPSQRMQEILAEAFPGTPSHHWPITPLGPVPMDRQRIRETWGVSDDCTVLTILADPPEAGSTLIAGWITALTEYAGTEVKLMMAPEMDPHRRSLKALKAMGMDVLIRDDAAIFPWRVLPGVDIAVVLGEETEQVQWDASKDVVDESAVGIGPSLRLAEHLGIPLVMEEGACLNERFTPEEHLLSCPPSNPRLLARQIQRLLEDKSLRQSLSERLKTRIQIEDEKPVWLDEWLSLTGADRQSQLS